MALPSLADGSSDDARGMPSRTRAATAGHAERLLAIPDVVNDWKELAKLSEDEAWKHEAAGYDISARR